MDNYSHRHSEAIDLLQEQIDSSANETKDLLKEVSEQSKKIVAQVIDSPATAHLKETTKNLYVFLITFAQEIKDIIVTKYDPRILCNNIFQIISERVTAREVIFGGVGLLVGSLVGFGVAFVICSRPEVLRYMTAVQCLNYTGTDGVVFVDDALTPSKCNKNDVLVVVKAGSVNSIDVDICKGYGSLLRNILSPHYKYSNTDLPITLGRNCTGLVIEIGQNVSRLEVGDEVWLTAPFWAPGTLSQYVLAPENLISHKPKMIGFEGACSLPYAGSLALSALEKANVTYDNARHKRILVHGGCSPVGCVLIQVLKAWGATVTTTCFKRAVPVAKALGVKDIIALSAKLDMDGDGREVPGENMGLLRKELELREKYHAVISTTRCELSENELYMYCYPKGKVISTLPPKLRSDSFGFFMGALFSLYIKAKCFIQTTCTGQLSNFGEAQICSYRLDKLSDLVEKGHLQTVVDRVFQPHEIEDALNHIQSTDSIGSTVITFR